VSPKQVAMKMRGTSDRVGYIGLEEGRGRNTGGRSAAWIEVWKYLRADSNWKGSTQLTGFSPVDLKTLSSLRVWRKPN